MDPLTIGAAVSVASKAFSAIKSGFAVGRDIESMSKDIGRWMGAVSDVDNAEKMAKNPPLFKKLFAAGSVEEEAMQAYIAKKKLQQQRTVPGRTSAFASQTLDYEENVKNMR